jgi:uncharacterized membrane protein required for colicin V production
MVETILSVFAILVILALAWAGIVFGVFYELTSALLLFIAMIVTLRYWYLATGLILSWVPATGSYAAFIAYWALFLIGCLPLIAVMNGITQDSVPRYPKVVDSVLGFIFGFASAVILMCSIMTSLPVIVPKVWAPYDRSALLLPFDRAPITTYQYLEKNWLGIATTDPAHTRFPTFEKTDLDDFEKYWQ